MKQDLDVRTTRSGEVEPGELQTPLINVGHLESQMTGLSQQITELLDQAETLQEQLDRLDHRTSFGNDQLETLTRHLSDVADWAGPLDRRLAELVAWAEESREGLSQLAEGIRKLSRTQFKTNSLAEAQQERLQSALETLQDLAARKQEAAEKSRQQQREAEEVARREARVVMVMDLFPALDGLESALESGHALLERVQQPLMKPGFLTRLSYALGLREWPTTVRDTQALAAWLDGLDLVHERFMALLRTEGIQLIRAEGQQFDPHWHVAVEAVERLDFPPGTVVEEHRPGYRLGNRVLRYAEVVVTRDEVEPEMPPMAAQEAHRWDIKPVAEEESPALADWGAVPKEIAEAGGPDAVKPTEVPEQIPEFANGPSASEAHPEPGQRAERTEPDTPTLDIKDDRLEVAPDIDKLIARFEERQRAQRSNR